MLRIHTAERIEPLARLLGDILDTDPLDPMTPEWIAVPSEGMRRWLSLQLAGRLGAQEGASDGIAANIEGGFPASLRRAVLEQAALEGAGADHGAVADADPWQVERLTWTVLGEISDPSSPLSGLFGDPTHQGSPYSRARRIADLFDRYHLHRDDMVRHWADGRDLDAVGRALGPHQLWQPQLWRLVRAHIGVPSPPERIVGLLDALHDGSLALDLPRRLVMFGLSALPGGPGFLDLADAVGAHRDLHLFLVDPSPAASASVVDAIGPPPPTARLRSEDDSASLVRNPLLRAWGRLNRETTILLADGARQGVPATEQVPASDAGAVSDTLLGRVQHDLHHDLAPVGSLVPAGADTSVQFHSTYGRARQVEVARDVILHLLADDPTLSEDDVVVLVPALDEFAPIVQAVLGPSAENAGGSADVRRLRYRIADRSLHSVTPLLEAVERLLRLATSRFDVTQVLDLVATAPVRTRFGFGDDDVARIGEWAVQANVRWGLDEQHRDRHGLPAVFDTNTWRAATERLLMGAAVGASSFALGDSSLALGDTATLAAAGEDAQLAGRLAELLWRLELLEDATRQSLSIGAWLDLIVESVEDLFAVGRDDAWQWDAFTRAVSELRHDAAAESAMAHRPLPFTDVRRALEERLAHRPGRADFFRGGVTVSSLTPLRGVPFKVVILLGMDQSAFTSPAPDGDDLSAAAPLLGDRDSRGELRQSLLEAVLAARSHLVVVRDGRDVVTNQRVPPAVPVAELIDAALSNVAPAHRESLERRICVEHPRQAHDERAFTPGALMPGRTWSFDSDGLAAALARRERSTAGGPFLSQPLARDESKVIELSDLHEFLRDPVRHFVQERLGVRFPTAAESPSTMVPLELKALDMYDVGSRLFQWLREGGSVDDWTRVERRVGTLGPSVLGDKSVDDAISVARALMDAAIDAGVSLEPSAPRQVDFTISDGTRIVGTVDDSLTGRPGAARLTYASDRPAFRLAAWLDLLVLVATDPGVAWRSVSVARTPSKSTAVALQLEPIGDAGPLCNAALDVVVDLYRRGSAEPLPLFPKVSFDLWSGVNPSASWSHHMGWGEGDDVINRLVTGGMELREILAIRRTDSDPITASGPSAGRARTYAEYLWGAVESSSLTIDLAATDSGAAASREDAPL